MDGGRQKYRVTDIAAQAGLSRATVDRVLHERVGVRPETVAQVERAIRELDRQRSQVHLSGTTILLDLVMQATARFADACRTALEAELHALRPAVARARFHIREHSDPAAAAAILERIARRGSQGVILKAPDHSRGDRSRCEAQGCWHSYRDVRDRRPREWTRGERGRRQLCSGSHSGVPDHELGRVLR